MDFFTHIGRIYVWGGWVMHPILLLWFIGLFFGLRLAWQLRRARRIDIDVVALLLARYVRAGRLDRAQRLAQAAQPGALGSVLAQAIDWLEPNPIPALRAMEVARQRVETSLNLPLLRLRQVAQLAFYLGVLGTVLGTSDALWNPWCGDMRVQGLNDSISLALITSAFGLVVAAACIGTAAALSGAVQRSVQELDAATVRLGHAVCFLGRRWQPQARRLSRSRALPTDGGPLDQPGCSDSSCRCIGLCRVA